MGDVVAVLVQARMVLRPMNWGYFGDDLLLQVSVAFREAIKLELAEVRLV